MMFGAAFIPPGGYSFCVISKRPGQCLRLTLVIYLAAPVEDLQALHMLCKHSTNLYVINALKKIIGNLVVGNGRKLRGVYF